MLRTLSVGRLFIFNLFVYLIVRVIIVVEDTKCGAFEVRGFVVGSCCWDARERGAERAHYTSAQVTTFAQPKNTVSRGEFRLPLGCFSHSPGVSGALGGEILKSAVLQ